MNRLDKKMLDLMRLINTHEEEWLTICGCGKYPIDYAEYIRLHKALTSMGCDETTLVLLTHHMYAVQDVIAERLQLIADWMDEVKRNGSGDCNLEDGDLDIP